MIKREDRPSGNRYSRRKRWFIGIFLFFLIVAASVTAYGFDRISNALEQSYQPIKRLVRGDETTDRGGSGPGGTDSGSRDTKETDRSGLRGPISVLLLGIDEREFDKGRTDTIILAILNPDTKKVTMVSLPRDTYVPIAEKGYSTKVNSAYQYGLPTVIATAEDFFQIPIDYYVKVDFKGFEDAIDAIGGITVNVEKDMYYVDRAGGLTIDLQKGIQKLNGEQALGYARFRYDALGDLGRIERQQKVIRATVDKALDIRTGLKILDLVDIVGENVATDIQPSMMFQIANTFRSIKQEDIESVTVDGRNDRFGPQNLWYYLVSDDERDRISDLLKERLELGASSENLQGTLLHSTPDRS